MSESPGRYVLSLMLDNRGKAGACRTVAVHPVFTAIDI